MQTIVVIGGGAAGFFGAISCKEANPISRVILLEKTNQILSKVRISGGGRCNVTHACFDPEKLVQNYPRGHKELIGPFQRFQPKDTVHWFEERGVTLKTEADGRMFPITDSSETIIQCLLKTAEKSGVEILKQQRISLLEKREGRFYLQVNEREMEADAVLLATGSSPWGYEVAKAFGHTIVHPVPSLFTFNVPTSPLLDLAGVAAPNVILTIKETGQKSQGPLLLTHWGFSGPAVLKLSAWAAVDLHKLNYKATLLINWTAAENQEVLYKSLLKLKEERPQQVISPLLPSNLLRRFVDPRAPMGQFSNKALHDLAGRLFADPYLIDGKTTYKQEFVTAGGIHLKQVDFKTMQSRLVPGLFFAGEILNIDGVTGGFNFQNAWTTSWIAGQSIKAFVTKGEENRGSSTIF